MDVVCAHCQAFHWADEKSSRSTIANPIFSQCCCYGEMPIMADPTVPPLLQELTGGTSPRSKLYRTQSRQINQALSFTSTGIKVDESINKRGPYCFKINVGEEKNLSLNNILAFQGAWMHRIGNWMARNGEDPKFAQIFTIDTEQAQLECRKRHMPEIDPSLLQDLQSMLIENNPFVTLYRNAKTVQEQNPTEEIKIIMKSDLHGLDKHRYNKPMASDVGAVLIGNEADNASTRDIVLHKSDGTLRRINEVHPSYDSLHYTMLFPNGEPGFHNNIKRETETMRKRTNVTPREFYAHRMHFRPSMCHIFGSGRIFLQYIVDVAAKIESYRLSFIRNHQSQLRAELYSGIVDAVENGDHDSSTVGQRVILPATFTGSDRQCHQQYQDSMAIVGAFVRDVCEVRKFGAPDMFITITANQAWDEITGKLQTTTFTDGYPVYMRPDNGRTVTVHRGGHEVDLDNRWVVPYSPFLLLRYRCHINVEVCGTVRAVKYLHKYLHKGGDRTLIKLSASSDKEHQKIDEIQRYLDSRWLSSHEAVWRTLEYKLHDNYPNVVRLAIHMKHQEFVHFQDDSELEALAHSGPPRTTLTAWFEANEEYPQGRNLKYMEYPTMFWYTPKKMWIPRKTGMTATVGRMRTVPPNQTEMYYLRLLLCHVVGARCYEDIRRVQGVVHSSYHEAAVALGIAVNDNEWKLCLQEAIAYKSGRQLRLLFCTIIEFCETGCSADLWEAFKHDILDDILHSRQRHEPNATFNDIINEGLNEINAILTGFGRSLEDYTGMPQLETQDINQEILNERNHVIIDIDKRVQQLTPEQAQIFEAVVNAVSNKTGRMFFIDAQGGCGKTYVLNVIIDALRSKGSIVLATASSGVAAILLNGGRTAHSTFRMPVARMDINSRCSIKSQSKRADLIRNADLLIYDEAPMTSWMHINCLDKSLQDLTGNTSYFGGKVMVFAGDFRQVLPVIPRASREETIRQCLKFWNGWGDVTQLSLKENLRVKKITTSSNKEDQIEFLKFLSRIGNGIRVDEENENPDIVTIPECMRSNTVEDLINFVFPSFVGPGQENCALLAPKNDMVDSLNSYILDRVDGEERVYLSIDTVLEDECQNQYPTEYLNSINMGGLPPHKLCLKTGVPIILLRNLNLAGGLANGTRLTCLQLQQHSIRARIVTGPKTGDVVIIPRIKLMPSDARLPFTLKRHQFPVKLNWAMTINKAQGQTLNRTGLMLSSACFGHGQLYVAMSRVGCKNNLKVYAPHQSDQILQHKTLNIVYEEIIGHNSPE